MIIPKRTALALVVACAPLFLPASLRAQDSSSGDWRYLFNGEDLTGWTELNGDHVFEASDGEIVGRTVPGQPNGFLVTEEEFGDFVLELEVRVDVLMNNSGIQFRSLSTPDYQDGRVHGYQAEIDTKPQRWSGSIYDEARRGWLYILEINPAGKLAFVNNTWNHYHIEAVGNTNRVWVNGIPTAHLVDDETTRGFIGLQLHANGPDDPRGSHQIRFRNIRIRTQNLEPSPFDDIFVVNLIPNHVSGQERAQGFALLWDGGTADGWTGLGGTAFPADAWAMNEGELRARAVPADSADIVTEQAYGAFELKFEFNPASDDATCGVNYLLSDSTAAPTPSQYCRMASQKLADDEWNRGVIRVHPDRRVEYWLNEIKLLEYLRESDAPMTGRILLQHQNGEAAYRSIKIKRLN